MDYAEVGKRIASCRVRQRLTQEDLSELSGVSIPHISNIENGKTKIKVDTLVRLSNALHVSTDYLLCGSVDAAQPIQDQEIAELLKGCDAEERSAIYQIVKSCVQVFQKKKTGALNSHKSRGTQY